MIDTKALRSRILDLAIQGKLTVQLESDGTAEDLFPKNIKDVDDTPFDIPNNWKWCKGIDCFKPIESRKPSGEYFNYIDIDAIDNKHQKINQIRIVPTKEAPSRASRAVFDGSTLFSLVRPYLRNIAYVDSEASNSIASTGFFVATSNGSLYPLFLYYMMISDYVVMGLNEFMKGDNSPSIRKGHIEQWLFPIPPLAEQKRIVERVEEIFRLLDTIDQAQEKYSADSQILKAKLITAGIQGKLTKQLESDGTAHELYQQIQAEKQKLIKEGKIKKEKPLPPISPDEIPFEIPQNWMWVRLGKISSKITDGEHKTPRRVSSFCGYYLLSARNITNNLIKLDDVDYVDEEEYNIISKRCNPKRNDVLISCSGSIGRCCVVEDDNKYVMVRSAAMVSLIEISPKYVMYCIHSKDVQKQISYKAKATAQANLFQEPIKNLIIPLPPLAEQKRIADVLERALGVFE